MIQINLEKKLRAPAGEMLLSVDFSIEKGMLIGLFGKSGAGKTSLLRMIAGLLRPDKGLLKVHDQVWVNTSRKLFLKPQKRNVGVVFQDYALFPNMNVRQNLAFALRKGQNPKVIDELIDITALGELQKRKPHQLSGGQQQRVALARAIVQKPEVLLLDEPLSALDMEMRVKLRAYLLEVHKAFNLTTILISHDVSEMLALADKVIKLDNGKVEGEGKASDLFKKPATGFTNQISGKILMVERRSGWYDIILKHGGGELSLKLPLEKGRVYSVGDELEVTLEVGNV